LVEPGLVADHFENDNENVTEQLAEPDFESLDPYSVLGVPERATTRQIKQAFHKLSKQYHPDRLPSLPNQQDTHTTFTSISNAYEILRDPDKRREHDLTLLAFHTVSNNAPNDIDDEDSLSEEENNVFGKCNWSHIVTCNIPHLKPLKCTFDGCNNLVHHLCQIAFEQREGFSETMLLKCCLHHPQSPFWASKLPLVNNPEDKLHSSTATNSKTSMADSSRLPNDAGKKASTTDDSSSSDESSSSDDSDDGARPAPPKARGKDLAFQSRFGQGKQVRLGAPSADESSEESSDSSIDRKDSAHSATTTGRGKILAGEIYAECYLQPIIGPPSLYQEMLVNVFTLMCSRPMLVRPFQAQKSLMK
jgi:curved DNA-binding protein CbpA